MKKQLFILFVLLFLVSCNFKQEEQQTNNISDTEITSIKKIETNIPFIFQPQLEFKVYYTRDCTEEGFYKKNISGHYITFCYNKFYYENRSLQVIKQGYLNVDGIIDNDDFVKSPASFESPINGEPIHTFGDDEIEFNIIVHSNKVLDGSMLLALNASWIDWETPQIFVNGILLKDIKYELLGQQRVFGDFIHEGNGYEYVYLYNFSSHLYEPIITIIIKPHSGIRPTESVSLDFIFYGINGTENISPFDNNKLIYKKQELQFHIYTICC